MLFIHSNIPVYSGINKYLLITVQISDIPAVNFVKPVIITTFIMVIKIMISATVITFIIDYGY